MGFGASTFLPCCAMKVKREDAQSPTTRVRRPGRRQRAKAIPVTEL